MKPEDMVVVDIVTGCVVEGNYKPSSDTATHLELYRKYHSIKGIVHSHSTNAVAFAQAGMDIPALGTTHADYFYGDISCTRELSKDEIENDYEKNTGKVIIEELEKEKLMKPQFQELLLKIIVHLHGVNLLQMQYIMQ